MSVSVKALLLFATFLTGLLVGLLMFAPLSQHHTVVFETSYAEVSVEEMIAQADFIFLGEVNTITPAHWNQDSGKYWQQDSQTAVPFHEVEITVLQPLASTLANTHDNGKSVSITVLGPSPVDSGVTDEVEVVGSVAHDLRVGEQAIFFVVQRDMAWRGGTRPILRFMGDPAMGYLTQGRDGWYHLSSSGELSLSLDALQEWIAQR